MKRIKWLIATVTALFVLQAPLCVFACTQASAGATTGAVDAMPPSCHGGADVAPNGVTTTGKTPDRSMQGTATAPRPMVPPSGVPMDANSDCGCGVADTGPLRSVDDASSEIERAERNEREVFVEHCDTRTQRVVRRDPQRTDLPPPDILLRKATLLI